jgi:hypothetical protein
MGESKTPSDREARPILEELNTYFAREGVSLFDQGSKTREVIDLWKRALEDAAVRNAELPAVIERNALRGVVLSKDHLIATLESRIASLSSEVSILNQRFSMEQQANSMREALLREQYNSQLMKLQVEHQREYRDLEGKIPSHLEHTAIDLGARLLGKRMGLK